MKRYTVTEILLGAIVLLLALVYGTYSLINFSPKNENVNIYNARFGNATGVQSGQDIKIGGALVGKVKQVYFDKEQFEAVVVFSAEESLQIPEDSKISILSSGVLGGKYISITPGVDKTYLKDGDYLLNVEGSQSLEEIIARAIFVVRDKASDSFNKK